MSDDPPDERRQQPRKVTDQERSILAGLASVGGLHTYTRDGINPEAARVFDAELVPLLLGLEARGLVRLQRAGRGELTSGPPPRFQTIAAVLTPAGRAAIR